MHWITEQSSRYDLVCLTGDFIDTRITCTHNAQQQASNLREWFRNIQATLFVCSGNHDFVDNSLAWLKSDDKKWFGDGDQECIHGLRVASLGYEDYHFEKLSDCDVLLTHVPPANTSVATQHASDFGCPQLRAALKSKIITPGHLLCGHVHSPRKHAIKLGKTIVSNPGGNHGEEHPSYCTLEILESGL